MLQRNYNKHVEKWGAEWLRVGSTLTLKPDLDNANVGMISLLYVSCKLGFSAAFCFLIRIWRQIGGTTLCRIKTLKKELLPLATVITPNIPEAEVLADMKIANEEEMIIAAEKISKKFGCAILVKGGHQINDANDLLYRDDAYTWFHGKRINNSNTHGTGCTLSSAIASNLAKGYDLDTSVKRAKDYISGALKAMLDLGKGSGPMDHSFAIDNEYARENVQ